MELEPGTVLVDRYRLEKMLGEGGFGTVWAATHLGTDKGVALKLLKTSSDEAVLRRFRREAKAVSAVNHPNVVAVHDIFNLPDGAPVMVMDLLNGQDLGQRLAQVGRLSLGETASILTPILSAIGAAHAAGVVHRDLKPDNIFLHVRGDGKAEPKVLDFGIAKLTSQKQDAMRSANLTQTGAVLGTPYYMSPEQVFGEKDLDHRADVWAMGVIIYECLSGKRPYDGANFGQLFKAITLGKHVPLAEAVPELPAEVAQLVEGMLQTDCSQRLSSLAPAFELLGRYCTAPSTDLPPAFRAPVAPAITPVMDVPSGSALQGSAESAADSGDQAVASQNVTKDGFSRTGSPRLPMNRNLMPLVLAGIVVLGGLSAGVFVLRGRSAESTPDPESGSQLAGGEASAPSLSAALSSVPKLEPTPPSPDAGIDAMAAAQRAIPKPGAIKSKPRPKPGPTPSASAVSVPAPAPSATTLPGNVVEKAPF
ncbi:MAG: protein kinase [Polyangiaceae bacterium]